MVTSMGSLISQRGTHIILTKYSTSIILEIASGIISSSSAEVELEELISRYVLYIWET